MAGRAHAALPRPRLSSARRQLPAPAAGPVGQSQAAAVAVGLAGGGDDERGGVVLQPGHLAEVEDDVEVALRVDDVPQDGTEPPRVLGRDLAVDGHDDGATGTADRETRLTWGMLAASYRDAPFARHRRADWVVTGGIGIDRP